MNLKHMQYYTEPFPNTNNKSIVDNNPPFFLLYDFLLYINGIPRILRNEVELVNIYHKQRHFLKNGTTLFFLAWKTSEWFDFLLEFWKT
jgi:hypothetical protein